MKLEIDNLNIRYGNHVILNDGRLCAESGRVTLIIGASGSGKTSILYHIGMLNKNHTYKYKIDDIDIWNLNEKKRAAFRRSEIGYVLQSAMLFEHYDVLGNLKLYAQLVGKTYTENDYIEFLQSVDLNIGLHQTIQSLSGGERQRLAIVCVLLKKPRIIVLDEPTNSLDKQTEESILEMISSIAHKQNICIIMVSHSENAEKHADCIYAIKNSKLKEIKPAIQNGKPKEGGMNSTVEKLKFGFFRNYISYFASKFKWLHCLLIGIMVCSLLCAGFALYFVNLSMNTAKQNLLSINHNTVLVSENNMYLNQNLNTLSTDTLSKIEKLEATIFPYHKTMLHINGLDIFVLPYYHENEYDREAIQLFNHNTNGIYMSYGVYKQIGSFNYSNSSINMDVSVEPTSMPPIFFNQDVFVNGILKEETRSEYLQNEQLFIYMYYKDVMELYKNADIKENISAQYIVCDDFAQYMQVLEECDKLQIPYLKNIVNDEALQTIVSTMNLRKIAIFILISFIFDIMIISMFMNYFMKRKFEYALLRINGISNREISLLGFLDIGYKYGLAIIITSLIVIVSSIWFKVVDIETFLLIVMNICFVNVVTLLLHHKLLKKLSPEDVLRN